MRHQFQSPLEGLTLPQAFTLQRGLWRRDPPEAISRLINLEVDQAKRAHLLIERERKRMHSAPVETLFPWHQEPTFLGDARVMGLYKNMLKRLRRQTLDVRPVLQLPPALSPRGWRLEDARLLLGFVPEQAREVQWTVTILAAPSNLLLGEASTLINATESVLRCVADWIQVVAAPRVETNERGIRVALSRPDLASAPGLGDAIQAAALVSILQYRLVCLEHALYAPDDAKKMPDR